MKSIFESYILVGVVIFFIVVATTFVAVLDQFDQAYLLQSTAVATIENHHGLPAAVRQDLLSSHLCKACQLSFKLDGYHRYRIEVRFPLQLGILDFNEVVVLQAISLPTID